MANVGHGKGCKECVKVTRAHAKAHRAFLALGQGWTPTTRVGVEARAVVRVTRKALRAHTSSATVLLAYKVADYLPKYAPRGNTAG